MADNVRWIKLKVGMFDGISFKKIKRAKIGGESFRDKLTAVWFELMDFAGKCNHGGALIDSNEIPYHELEDIATIIDRDTSELELCMKFYISEGMVEIINDVFLLSNWARYQNEDKLQLIREQSRIRMRNYRARQNLIADISSTEFENIDTECGKCYANSVTEASRYADVTRQNKNIDIEKEIDIKDNKSDITVFAQFWDEYPRKIGKPKAEKVFARLSKATQQKAIDAVRQQKKSVDWTKDNGQYIPHPTTWLNRGGWDDQLTYTAESESKSEEPTKKQYGEFGNVLLTAHEYDELNDRMGDKGAAEYIEKLSRHMKSKGKEYSSHYATLLDWWNGDGSPVERTPRKYEMKPDNVRIITDDMTVNDVF